MNGSEFKTDQCSGGWGGEGRKSVWTDYKNYQIQNTDTVEVYTFYVYSLYVRMLRLLKTDHVDGWL